MQINNPSVDLTSNQTIAGNKTFTGTLNASGAFTQANTSTEFLVGVVHSASATMTSSPNKLVNATSGNLTMTLPVASTSSTARIMITKTDATANTVTIVPQAGGSIGGAVSVILAAQYQSVTLLNINSAIVGGWAIVGKT